MTDLHERSTGGNVTNLRRFAFWLSPDDQPSWARPVLLCLAIVAGVGYGWRMGSSIEIFYAAAVRSMSMSWHNFFFASFDPAATVSVDKLPGAFWIQALSVRLFGVHTWAMALPQVLEGWLTVLVLYRAVRRLAGSIAGIVAALVFAISPATMTLNRGNISDTLLVLLGVLAADSVAMALVTGRHRSVAMAGIWVGLAFQAKMIEAWFVLPALCLTYLVFSNTSIRKRVLQLATMLAITAVVSLSWMAFVFVTPSTQRPYVDGSQNDSIFQQVFDYNGFGRVGKPSPNQLLGRTLDIPFLEAKEPAAALNRLFVGSYGRDTGWLIPLALIMIVVGLVVTWRRPRTDLSRAGIVLWGTWLIVFAAAFSVTGINSYYLGALSPPIAAVVGIGAALAWQRRQLLVVRIVAFVAVVVTVGYGYWLLPESGTGLPSWLAVVLVAIGACAAISIVSWWVFGESSVVRSSAVIVSGLAMLIVPFVASVSVVTSDLGAFDTPFQSEATTAFLGSFFGAPLQVASTIPKLESVRNGAPDLMATQTSVLAASFIFLTGQEVLPIGGYSGTIPEPSVGKLARLVASRQFHLVITAARSSDPRIVWIEEHCIKLPAVKGTQATRDTLRLGLYYCLGPTQRAGSGS